MKNPLFTKNNQIIDWDIIQAIWIESRPDGGYAAFAQTKDFSDWSIGSFIDKEEAENWISHISMVISKSKV